MSSSIHLLFTKPIIWFKLILISWYDASHWVRKQIASSIVPESSQHTLLSRSIYIYVIVVYNVYMPALPFPAFSTFIHLSLSASFPTEAAQSDNSLSSLDNLLLNSQLNSQDIPPVIWPFLLTNNHANLTLTLPCTCLSSSLLLLVNFVDIGKLEFTRENCKICQPSQLAAADRM